MTSKDPEAIQNGVRDAWDLWLDQHPITLEMLIQDAVAEAVGDWLEANPGLIQAAVNEAVTDRQSDT
jgi:hypothetical protein